MLLPGTISAVLSNHVCRERVCTPAHLCRSTVDAALDIFLGTEQPSQAQAGRERFREAADAKYLLAICQSVEASRHRTFKREVAIDIILHNQEVIATSQADNFDAPCFRQSSPRRIMKVW